MSRLTSAQIINIAQGILLTHGLTYDEQEGLNARFIEYSASASTRMAESCWRVTYVSEPGLFEQHDYFMYIADETSTLLYILGPHGKLHMQVKQGRSS